MSITKAAISSVSGITAANKTVDGNTNATLNTSAAVYNGSVAGDVLTVGTVTGNFNTPNIGNGKTVYLTGITLGGAAADNYTLLSDSGTTTASILTLHNLSAPAPTTRNTLRFETSDLRAADLDALLVKTAAAAKNSTEILVRTIRDPDEQQAGIVSIALSGETAYSHAGFQFSLPAGIFAQAGGDEEPIRISTFMGQPLPSWLHYDAVAKTFVAATVPAGALPLHVWVQGKKAAVMLNISDM